MCYKKGTQTFLKHTSNNYNRISTFPVIICYIHFFNLLTSQLEGDTIVTQPQNNKYPTHAPYDDEVDSTEENNSTATPYTEQEDTHAVAEEDSTEDQDYYPDTDSGLDEYYTGDDFINDDSDYQEEDTAEEYTPRRTPFADVDNIPESNAAQYEDFSSSHYDGYDYDEDSQMQQQQGNSYFTGGGPVPPVPPAQVKQQYEDFIHSGDTGNGSSNWPEFLKTQGNQLFFAIINLVVSLFTGIGIILPFYYLFILDNSYEKDKASKVINWVALLLPLIVLFLFVIVSLFAVAVGSTGPRM